MNATHDRAKSIFLSAAEIAAPEERRAFVESQCAGDDALRGEVDELLRHQQSLGSFLEAPAVGASVEHTALCDEPLIERPGMVIGPYKLVEQIGEGGMGVVFMAEQERPVKRKVALKIIKPGMDTRQVIARFEAERQALALMDHPNIAKVLDAGMTESGRPYFIMELVKGVPITKYCDEKHLPLDARLELFVQVCQAVQHAHQKGIIHRDIKPNNVLVAEYDKHAVPKMIDFGVAKATAQRLTERTIFTEFGQVLGTIEYMSPEQSKFNQLDIDTRSDIYSLGVLLYELLTGSTPFGRKRLNEAAFDEMLRIIREEEPPKPSTRLSSSDALPSIAANRSLEPLKLNRLVQGELDWIVMKSLEKDRNRRYETASAFAGDIQRYLDDETVEACPPSAAYRFRKFARRNKDALSAGVTIAVILVLATLVSGWQAVRATKAELQARANLQLARENEQRAKSEAAKSKLVARFMTDMITGVDPFVATSRETTILDILDQTSGRLNELKDQPEVEADVRGTLGYVYRNAGEYARSESMLREALRIYRTLYGDQHDKVAGSLLELGRALAGQRKRNEAEAVFRQALTMQRSLLGNSNSQVANTLINLYFLLEVQGKFAESEALLREALAIRRKAYGSDSPELAGALCYLPEVLAAQGKFAEAELQCREALALIKALDLKNVKVPSYSINALAWFLATRPDAHRRNDALAIELAQRAVDATPQLGFLWNTLAIAHYYAGDWNAAIAALEKSMELANGGNAFDWYFLAMAEWQLGHKEEARNWYEKAVEWMESNDPNDLELRRFGTESAELLGITDSNASADPQPAESQPSHTNNSADAPPNPDN